MELKEFFNVRSNWERNLVFFDLLESMVDFVKDVFASFDIIVEWFVEIIRSCIDELYKLLGSEFGDCIIGLFCRDVKFIVSHRSRSEQRHKILI